MLCQYPTPDEIACFGCKNNRMIFKNRKGITKINREKCRDMVMIW
jgi:hypothetical protein